MKKVVVGLEHRFYKFDGAVYTKLAFSYGYWSQYLDYFDEVKVVARVERVVKLDPLMVRADGGGVKFLEMPYYVGPKKFFLSLPKLLFFAFRYVRDNRFFILRSGNVSNLLFLYIVLFRRKYLREFPGNIQQGVVGYSGDRAWARSLAFFLDAFAKIQARHAEANSFVSHSVKAIYETGKPSYVFSSFDVEEIGLSKNNYSLEGVARLITLGRLENEKGHMDLLSAMVALRSEGMACSLTIIGDGTARSSLEAFSDRNVLDCNFLGAMTDRSGIFNAMCSHDIFVLPSHTEGMPRALLEAMALGLPCVATSVGGVPEVILPDCLVPPKKPSDLAKAIANLCGDENERREQGQRNYLFVRERYSLEKLKSAQRSFWSCLYE